MKRAILAITGIFLLWQTGGSPAFAGKKDDAWAVCIWEKAPTSAAKWLQMAEVKKAEFLGKDNRYDLLAVRIQGFCNEALTPQGKKYAPSFNTSAVRAALERTRPSEIRPDSPDSKAIRCEMYEDDVLLGKMIGFGDPKGLRPSPPATAIKCQRIQDDGTLIDA